MKPETKRALAQIQAKLDRLLKDVGFLGKMTDELSSRLSGIEVDFANNKVPTMKRLRAIEAVAVEASSFSRILKGNFCGSQAEMTALMNLTSACDELRRIDEKRIRAGGKKP